MDEGEPLLSMFGTILSKIFGHEAQQTATAGAAPGEPAQAVATNTGAAASGSAPPAVASAPSSDTTGPASTAPSAAAGASQTSAGGGGSVDVAHVLDGMPHREKLDWRHSIVDLLKLLDLDSSLSARKELAHELNYTGDTSDSATMNMWLHKEVMRKLAANGGKLPADLTH